MQKPPKVHDKHFLKAVHQNIDLYDRKLAHLNRFEVFASDLERDTAVRKLNSKRELLVKTARKLADDGIEFKDSDLPRSFRPVLDAHEPVAAPEMDQDRTSAGLWA